MRPLSLVHTAGPYPVGRPPHVRDAYFVGRPVDRLRIRSANPEPVPRASRRGAVGGDTHCHAILVEVRQPIVERVCEVFPGIQGCQAAGRVDAAGGVVERAGRRLPAHIGVEQPQPPLPCSSAQFLVPARVGLGIEPPLDSETGRRAGEDVRGANHVIVNAIEGIARANGRVLPPDDPVVRYPVEVVRGRIQRGPAALGQVVDSLEPAAPCRAIGRIGGRRRFAGIAPIDPNVRPGGELANLHPHKRRARRVPLLDLVRQCRCAVGRGKAQVVPTRRREVAIVETVEPLFQFDQNREIRKPLRLGVTGKGDVHATQKIIRIHILVVGREYNGVAVVREDFVQLDQCHRCLVGEGLVAGAGCQRAIDHERGPALVTQGTDSPQVRGRPVVAAAAVRHIVDTRRECVRHHDARGDSRAAVGHR